MRTVFPPVSGDNFSTYGQTMFPPFRATPRPPVEYPDGALVDSNGNFILDYQGNYILTTEV